MSTEDKNLSALVGIYGDNGEMQWAGSASQLVEMAKDFSHIKTHHLHPYKERATAQERSDARGLKQVIRANAKNPQP